MRGDYLQGGTIHRGPSYAWSARDGLATGRGLSTGGLLWDFSVFLEANETHIYHINIYL